MLDSTVKERPATLTRFAKRPTIRLQTTAALQLLTGPEGVRVKSKVKIALVLVAVLVTLLVTGGVVAYRYTQRVPEFYEQALLLEPTRARATSREMVQQATGLAREARKPGDWQAIFTAEQINGWLAVDLVENHSGALPKEVAEPRVAIDPGTATVACRYSGPSFTSVLSLDVDLSLAEANTVAIRLRRVRAGAMPLPISQVLEIFQTAARDLQWPVEWRQIDGDPVALISVPSVVKHEGRKVSLQLESLELRDGEIYIAGRSERIK